MFRGGESMLQEKGGSHYCKKGFGVLIYVALRVIAPYRKGEFMEVVFCRVLFFF